MNEINKKTKQRNIGILQIFCALFAGLYFLLYSVSPIFASTNYTYDQNGNLSSDGQNCYVYNDANQLSQVKNCSNNQLVAEYVYDYQGTRIAKKVYTNGVLQKTIYSPTQNFESVNLASNSASQNTSYVFANNQLIAKKNPDGTKDFYHNDNLGSTNLLTDENGNLVESTQYDPWGQILAGGTQSKYLYTGQQNDPETNLDYYNARYYDPSIRHFTQADTVIPNVYDPQSLNRYSYVRNNPLRYTDPSGHFGVEGDIGLILLSGLFEGAYDSLNYIHRAQEVPMLVYLKGVPYEYVQGFYPSYAFNYLKGESKAFDTGFVNGVENSTVDLILNKTIGEPIDNLPIPRVTKNISSIVGGGLTNVVSTQVRNNLSSNQNLTGNRIQTVKSAFTKGIINQAGVKVINYVIPITKPANNVIGTVIGKILDFIHF